MGMYQVDYTKILEIVNETRMRRGMSWRMVAAEIEIPVGTFNRISKGKRCSDSTFVSLMVWLGAGEQLKAFVKRTPQEVP